MGCFGTKVGSVKELTSPLFWRDILCEFLTTTMLLAYITMGSVDYVETFNRSFTHSGLAIAFVVFVLIEAFDHFNGGHMNPAVTLLFVCRGDLSIIKGLFYLGVQCLGGIAGSSLVYGIVAPEYRDVFVAVKPQEELGPYRTIAVEVVMTSLLCFISLSVTDKHRPKPYPMPGLPIGMAVGAGIMTSGMSSGGALNPIVPFGPAVVSGDFEHHWVYWVGPMLGSVAAIIVYFAFREIEQRYSPELENDYPRVDVDTKDENDNNVEEHLFLRQGEKSDQAAEC